ncbi:MAG: RidA family protein [Promethearchaeota archaeon]|nr:MAG: RidA family protein [Candidatus Lokiarchaeota archaeon]
MVEKEIIKPPDSATAGPYSPAIKAGNLIFVSGQGPKPGSDDIKDQTLSVFENIKTILEAAGAKISDIVKVTVYLNDMGNFGKMNRAYKKFFNENGVEDAYPARTTIEVADLPVAIMKLEIDVIAML